MPRRYADHLPTDGFTTLNVISRIGAFVLGASTLPFIWNVFRSCRYVCTATAIDRPVPGSARRHQYRRPSWWPMDKYGKATPQAPAESALWEASLFAEHDFHDVKISVKHHDPVVMIRAYELLAEQCDYPLNLGVTEAGPAFQGTIKSAVAFGALLRQASATPSASPSRPLPSRR